MPSRVVSENGGRRRSLRGPLKLRLLAWFLVFSLAPLLVTNAVGYQRSQVIIESLVERYLTAIAQVQSEHVRDRVDHYVSLLEAITAGNNFLAAGAVRAAGRDAGELGNVATKGAMDEYLREKFEELSVFQALSLASADGRVVASATSGSDLAIISPAELRAKFSSNVPRQSPASQPIFRLSVPVGPRRPPVAYLTATVTTLASGDFLQMPERLAGHVESFIVDQGGWPLYVSQPHGTVDYTASLMSPLIGMASGSRARYRDARGVEVIGTISDIAGYPWRFIAQVPATEALGALRELRSLSLGLEMLFVALLIATAWIVARDIVTPLYRLVDATRSVGRGDLTVRVPAQASDEVGELGRAFNEMASALAETTGRVRELHQREIERASQLATVGELASGVAHEIKNPVVGVANGLDLISRRVGDDRTLQPIIDEMSRQLTRIQQTLRELLTFARPATPSLAPVDVNQLVDRAVRLVAPIAEHMGVRLTVHVGPALPAILADEDLLVQALVNLLMNAVEATPSGGRTDVVAHGAEGAVVLEIRDTGRGIRPADLEHVFKPFFTTRHTGTGLGLSISREIVLRHGGHLTLESTEGEGTTVLIQLPLAATAEPSVPEHQETAVP